MVGLNVLISDLCNLNGVKPDHRITPHPHNPPRSDTLTNYWKYSPIRQNILDSSKNQKA